MLIKPFLDCSPMFVECKLNEPWNSPNNGRLLNRCEHSSYQCPSDMANGASKAATTSYVAVIGRSAARGGNARREDRDLQCRKADTFLIVEMAHSGILWMEPKDIRSDDIQSLQSLIANSPHRRNGYFLRETPGLNAVLIDGDMVLTFSCVAPNDVLAALLPPDETEEITRPPLKERDPDNIRYAEQRQVHWPHVIGLPVWIIAVSLLIHHVRRNQGTSLAGGR
jgi:hypothetical protein